MLTVCSTLRNFQQTEPTVHAHTHTHRVELPYFSISLTSTPTQSYPNAHTHLLRPIAQYTSLSVWLVKILCACFAMHKFFSCSFAKSIDCCDRAKNFNTNSSHQAKRFCGSHSGNSFSSWVWLILFVMKFISHRRQLSGEMISKYPLLWK